MNFDELQLKRTNSIKNAIEIIESGHLQFAFVVDDNLQLIGTITDGDIRRGLLQGYSLDASVDSIMHTKFKWLPVGAVENDALSLMRKENLHQIPVLDTFGRVADIFFLDDLIKPKVRVNPVVIMAGGEGRRLRPLTLDCPKPMLRVGDKPMLEIILEQCISSGFQQYYFSVNYLKNQIMDYFGDGGNWGVQIEYLEESKPLGTAGALSLLPKSIKHPIMVLNGDVLTRVNYSQLLRFHGEHQASATLCVREHKTHIPFGVIRMDDSHVQAIEEKPILSHHVNAGIYILAPSILDLVPQNRFYDMPNLLEDAITLNHEVSAFPIHEDWLDIGHHETFEFAKQSWPL